MTLTEMLDKTLKFEREPESEEEAEAIDRELTAIKGTFKDWLRTVRLYGRGPVIESTRRLLITLVDQQEESGDE